MPFAQRNLETESGWILRVILFNFAPFIPNKTPEHLLSLEFIQCVFHTLCFTKMGVVNSICFWGPSQKVTDININSGHFAVVYGSFAFVCVRLRFVCVRLFLLIICNDYCQFSMLSSIFRTYLVIVIFIYSHFIFISAYYRI